MLPPLFHTFSHFILQKFCCPIYSIKRKYILFTNYKNGGTNFFLVLIAIGNFLMTCAKFYALQLSLGIVFEEELVLLPFVETIFVNMLSVP